MQKTVLIIDDSFYMRSVLRKYLETAGYDVVGEADNGEKGIDLALSLKPAVITLDIILPDMVSAVSRLDSFTTNFQDETLLGLKTSLIDGLYKYYLVSLPQNSRISCTKLWVPG